MTDLSSTSLVFVLGSLRFDPRDVPEKSMRRLAKVLIEHPSTGTFFRGPVRLYSRGAKDIRLEYDFEIPDDENLADKFYHDVRGVVLSTFHVVGRWHHSHWAGVEHIHITR